MIEERKLIEIGAEEDLDTELELPFCLKPKDCGHKCSGVKEEKKCLPCLETECIAAEGSNMPTSDE